MADQAPANPGPPLFCHHQAVEEGRARLFQVFQLPDPAIRLSLFAALLVENAVVLLSGTYGTGKTQLVRLIHKLLFDGSDADTDMACETCHQELTAFDVLYHLDLAALQSGREIVNPKAMVSARFKFFNEIQRAAPGLFNALLPLLSERRLVYRDHRFEVPSFLCFMDRNPLDAGSSEIPEAFCDRVDFGFEIPAVHLEETMRLVKLRRREDGFHWGALDGLIEPALSFGQLEQVWADVKRVEIPKRTVLLAGMLTDAFRLCIRAERSVARPTFDLACEDCQFRGEICAHLLKVPGMRVDNSLLRLAQALAWVGRRPQVREQDLLQALPWCLAHRLSLRPEELRTQPSEQAWVRNVAVGEILRPRLPFWDRAVQALAAGDQRQLEEMGENDLVVRALRLIAARTPRRKRSA